MIDYNLSHYLPISAADNKELEMVQRANALPKMNMMTYSIMKMLGKREKEEFTAHSLEKLVEEVSAHVDEYKERVQNIKNYLTHLNIQQIVTPVRKISEFIEGDLIETDPSFFGTIVTQVQRLDTEHKKITNTPEKGKIAWIKIMLILAIISVIAIAGWWIMDSGMLTMPTFPTFGGVTNFNTGGGGPPPLMQQYPTPEALQSAIDRGEISEEALTPDMKKMLESYEPPKVTPIP